MKTIEQQAQEWWNEYAINKYKLAMWDDECEEYMFILWDFMNENQRQNVVCAFQSAVKIAQKNAWLPIETAPKDGTKVDLWLSSKRRATNCYWGLPEHSCGEHEGYCDSCPDHEGWIDGSDFMAGYTEAEPTHWQPLPQLPKEKSD